MGGTPSAPPANLATAVNSCTAASSLVGWGGSPQTTACLPACLPPSLSHACPALQASTFCPDAGASCTPHLPPRLPPHHPASHIPHP